MVDLFRGGVSVEECWDCQGTGHDPIGNTCPFCDGLGCVDEREDEMYRQDDAEDDDLCTPVQRENGA